MRVVETKTPEQQSCLMLHRTRHLFIRQQTSVINAIAVAGTLATPIYGTWRSWPRPGLSSRQPMWREKPSAPGGMRPGAARICGHGADTQIRPVAASGRYIKQATEIFMLLVVVR
jgi:hypothetical protein